MAVTPRTIAFTGGRDNGSGRIAGGTVSPGKGVSAAPSVVTVTADLATVAADVAVLVADGASPTQAHVTTLNTDFVALNAAYTALLADLAVALGGADFLVAYDTTAVGTKSKFRALLRAAEEVGERGGLT